MRRRLPPQMRALARTPLFRDLSRRELAAVQSLGTVVDVAPGRMLGRTGQHPCPVAVIVSGQLAATTRRGQRRFLHGGDCFGASVPHRDRAAGPEAFETVTPTTLFVMSSREVASLRLVCPRLATRLAGDIDPARAVNRDHKVRAMAPIAI